MFVNNCLLGVIYVGARFVAHEYRMTAQMEVSIICSDETETI